MDSSPWEVLGLQRGASRDEIRRRYRELARECHPDKLPPDERAAGEERFKRISAAYQVLIEGGDDAAWASMWDMLKDKQAWERIGEIVAAAIKTARERKAAQQAAPRSPRPPRPPRVFVWNVSLDDVLQDRERKLRLILSDREEPVYVTVRAREFPETERECDGERVRVEIRVRPHPVYKPRIIAEQLYLFTDVQLSWPEYLAGVQRVLDGGVVLDIPPFADLEEPVRAEYMDAATVLANLRLHGPSAEKWRGLSESARENLLEGLASICV